MRRLILILALISFHPAVVSAEGESSMEIKRLTPILFVERIEPCLPFWVERLGFTKELEVPEDDHLGFVSLTKDGVEIMYQTNAGLEKDLPAVAKSVGQPVSFLYLEVSKIDPIASNLEGVDVVIPKRKTFYGATEIVVREPGGHFVTFAEFAPQAASDPQ
jgi:uncharacterized glyoxalase superfamily protein PhnB